VDWTQATPKGFGNTQNATVWGMAEHNGELIVGTMNALGGQLWRQTHLTMLPMLRR